MLNSRNEGLENGSYEKWKYPVDPTAGFKVAAAEKPPLEKSPEPAPEEMEVGMRATRRLILSTRVSYDRNTLVYRYRLCYRMPLYCTGARQLKPKRVVL